MAGFRSQFEAYVAAHLSKAGCHYTYEPKRIPFVQPSTKKTYCPDFFIEEKDFFIEAKGIFSASDRKKHKLIQEQYPDLDLRFLFQNANLPIRRGSRTTCADWADKNGFQWAHKTPPSEWFL
tara:strand:- start:13683 stop:14048 length:366 start_codon:yes stop_codon:yes gene_type:complete